MEQGHEEVEFGLRAFPVVHAEAVQRELAEAQAATFLDGAAHALHAAAVALDARQAALLRPAAVAVHDDGDVPRQPGGVEAGGLEALKRIGGDNSSAAQLYTVQSSVTKPGTRLKS